MSRARRKPAAAPKALRLPPKRRRRVLEAELVEPVTAIAVPERLPPAPILPPIGGPAARLLAAWLEGKSDDTKNSYFASARHFAAWLVKHGHASAKGHAWDVITRALQVPEDEGNLLVAEWIASQHGMSKGGIATRCSGVRRLCRKLKAVRAIAYVPEFERPRASGLSPRERAEKYKGVSRAFDVLVAGLDRTVAAADATALDVRDWALVWHVSSMGLRRVELVGPRGLDLDDLDMADGVSAVHGKGRDRRERLRMPPPLMPILRRWLRVRAELARPDCRALYISLGPGQGGPIRDRSTINKMLRRRAVQFGADRDEHGKRFAPHDMRRIFCTETLAKYPPQRAIELTRHADVKTVQLYDLEQGQQVDAMADDVGSAVMRRGKTKGTKKGRKTRR